jgi:hypothetical protein
MKQMVEQGEVDALVPERVWQELSRGLMEQNLRACWKCCAIAARWRASCRSWTRCGACRSRRNGIPKSTPASTCCR